MDKLERYQNAVKDILLDIHRLGNSARNREGIDSQYIFDSENNHYVLIDVGWRKREYIYASFVHIDIKDEKIWIQRNNTEWDLAELLVKKGVKKEDIILGLHSPFMRQFSGYGVA